MPTLFQRCFVMLFPPGIGLHWMIALHATMVSLFAVGMLLVTEETWPSSVSLSVSAVVLKKVWLRTEAVPAALVLSAADVSRGFVEVPAPTVLALRNNSEDGFVVRFTLDPLVASSAQVSGLSQPVTFGSEGAVLTQPGLHRAERRFELRWRLQLAQGLTPGQHPWPVQIQVEPN